jgi:hypothetical protein
MSVGGHNNWICPMLSVLRKGLLKKPLQRMSVDGHYNWICPMLFFLRKGLLKKPLQRMSVGGLLAASSFFASGILELQMMKTYAKVWTFHLLVNNNMPATAMSSDLKAFKCDFSFLIMKKTVSNENLYEMSYFKFMKK